jgi:hypothetical protein
MEVDITISYKLLEITYRRVVEKAPSLDIQVTSSGVSPRVICRLQAKEIAQLVYTTIYNTLYRSQRYEDMHKLHKAKKLPCQTRLLSPQHWADPVISGLDNLKSDNELNASICKCIPDQAWHFVLIEWPERAIFYHMDAVQSWKCCVVTPCIRKLEGPTTAINIVRSCR